MKSRISISMQDVCVVMLLALPLTAEPARGQNYAAPNGIPYGGDETCGDPNNPCDLGGAVQDATDDGASGTTVFIRLPEMGAKTTIHESLIGAKGINDDVTFDTYLNDGVPTTCAEGIIAVEGDIEIEGGVTLRTCKSITFHAG